MASTEVVIQLIRYVMSFGLERLCFIPTVLKRHTLLELVVPLSISKNLLGSSFKLLF
jgi:hypothetical protein